MKALKYIFLLLLLIFVAGSIYIATLENDYHVKRTKIINAPAEVVFNKINDYTDWPEWSPWLGQDPKAEVTLGNVTSGVGASYAWVGKKSGEGNMETLSVTKDSISQKVDFIKPKQSTSTMFWKINETENGTEITWGTKGKLDFMSKATMAFKGGMEKQIGKDYEIGLVKLDSVIQADMQEYSITVNGITTRGGGYYLYQTTSSKIEEIPAKTLEMMPKLGMYAKNNNITLAGPSFILYNKYDTVNNAVIMSVAIPVTERVITDANSGILTGMMKPFTAIKTTLQGDYKNLKAAQEATLKHIIDNNFEQLENVPAMEVYLNSPLNTPNPADLRTEIFVPIKEDTGFIN